LRVRERRERVEQHDLRGGHQEILRKSPEGPNFVRALGTSAVTAGFEPAVACTTHAFQACSFGRSDTSPGNNLFILSDRARRVGPAPTAQTKRTPYMVVSGPDCSRCMPRRS